MSLKPAIYDFLLDPATGTGSFIANLLRRISGVNLEHKYRHDLFANEVMLLPYYIASLNIEHEYYARTGQYVPFDGICFADTLDLADRVAHKGLGERSLWVNDRNTERVEQEQDAKIMVVIGNPPYNVGQDNENDNNKNRKYDVIDARIRDTYAKDSHAANKNKLSDAYVKFFRWATDRLQGRDGIVCFVSNNSFVDQFSFDGMRKNLLQDFTQVYHLDLHGNVRRNPKLSGTTHNVFGIQVGVGVTVAIRSSAHSERKLYYYRVPEDWRREEKTGFLDRVRTMANVGWEQLRPDEQHNWLTEGMQPEFAGFLPMGNKDARSTSSTDVQTLFKVYSVGVNTARDQIAYSYEKHVLEQRVEQFVEDYNAEVSRWIRAGSPKPVDEFVRYDKVKWSETLKLNLTRGVVGRFDQAKIRIATYRPFCKRWLFFDRLLNERVYQLPQIYPVASLEIENRVICAANPGADYQTFLQVQGLLDIKCGISGNSIIQCFPLYTYDEDGSNRRENVTDWALARFTEAYGPGVTKRAIFDYVYAVLHHPQYRERYAENLKRELPRIPLLPGRDAFNTCARIGAELAALHLGYESAPEWPLVKRETPGAPLDWRVKKMRLTADKTAVVYNDWLTLEAIPPEVFAYRLGNRSALEWVIDQYQVSTDSRSGITSDPNRADDPQYIVRLVGQVVRVSVETVRLVRELADVVDLLAAVGVGVGEAAEVGVVD